MIYSQTHKKNLARKKKEGQTQLFRKLEIMNILNNDQMTKGEML